MWYIVKENERIIVVKDTWGNVKKIERWSCGVENVEGKWRRKIGGSHSHSHSRGKSKTKPFGSEWVRNKKEESVWVWVSECLCVAPSSALTFYTEFYNISSDKSLVGVKSDCTLTIQDPPIVIQSFWHTDWHNKNTHSIDLYDHSHFGTLTVKIHTLLNWKEHMLMILF